MKTHLLVVAAMATTAKAFSVSVSHGIIIAVCIVRIIDNLLRDP